MLTNFTLRSTLELAIAAEQAGALFYHTMAGRFVHEPDISKLFTRLGQEEKRHEEIIRKFIEHAPTNIDREEGLDRLLYLHSLSSTEYFDDEWFRQDERFKTSVDTLKEAFHYEKTILLYYQGIRDLLHDCRPLDVIIEDEKGHAIELIRKIPTESQLQMMIKNA